MFILHYVLVMYRNYEGDWGLGIGDWAQSPIPNPQSPNVFIILYFLIIK